MSTLAATTAGRSGAASIAVANRTRRHAERLAAKVGAEVVALADLGPALACADLVISCTGADGYVITTDLLAGQARPPGKDPDRERTERGARWSCWTWPCRATWNRPWPACPAWW